MFQVSQMSQVSQAPGNCAGVAQVCPTFFQDELHTGPTDFVCVLPRSRSFVAFAVLHHWIFALFNSLGFLFWFDWHVDS